ncbi:MAG: Flp pilus assembly complex ATPase component TadA [candidate division WS1 bacterium]|jgi:type IV pilus assembly protein PilB|nr:Flp pilus assembly complex ATPase component TadA [candidate division WS1 bacterium]
MMNHGDERLARALLALGIISEVEVEQARQQQQAEGKNLVQILLTSGLVSAHDIARATEAMADAEADLPAPEPLPVNETSTTSGPGAGLPADTRRAHRDKASLDSYEVDPAALQDVPRAVAQRYRLLPLQVSQDRILVAMADATDVFAMDEVRSRTGKRVEPVEVDRDELARAIEQYYSSHARSKMKLADTRDLAASVKDAAGSGMDETLTGMLDHAPVVRVVQEIVKDAVREGASDIHIEPRGEQVIVRYRRDGQLAVVTRLPHDMHRFVLSRIKVMAGEDIAETRKPQDGRFATMVDERPIDLRVSTLPTFWGEKAVLRILDKSRTLVSLNQLGFRPDTQKEFEQLINKHQGMLLVTGPTGSGKTTTLYASLHQLNDDTKNITTVEDPIEYEVEGLNQVQVLEAVDLTFATALRHVLRQDPDVILIGEVRDHDTAQMAFRASLTGHLVLSTLHTNDAPSAATRLIDIGIPPYIVASSLIGVLAQRLVRRLCRRCREACEPTPMELESLQLSAEQAGRVQFHRARGCQHCRNTGYSGRIALYELLTMTPEIRSAITGGADASVLRQISIKAGMKTLKYDGLAKIHSGITSAHEVAGVMFAGDEDF